jgi:hypothetical protein
VHSFRSLAAEATNCGLEEPDAGPPAPRAATTCQATAEKSQPVRLDRQAGSTLTHPTSTAETGHRDVVQIRGLDVHGIAEEIKGWVFP